MFSPLLDTEEPVDFRELAFDESPTSVIKAVKKADALPDLEGREVTFVVTPVAGEQAKLSKLQIGYQRAIWDGVATGRRRQEGDLLRRHRHDAGTGTITPIPVPDPNDDFASADQGKTRTCTLPSPALFVADQPALIDKKATLKALKKCIGDLDSGTKITVEGHTAGSSGANNDFAKTPVDAAGDRGGRTAEGARRARPRTSSRSSATAARSRSSSPAPIRRTARWSSPSPPPSEPTPRECLVLRSRLG